MAKTTNTKNSRAASKASEILAAAAAAVTPNADAPKAEEIKAEETPPVDAAPAPQDAPKAEAPKATPVHADDAKIAYAVRDGFRPTAGASLFAHTAVVLRRSGMSTVKPIPSALLKALMGNTAVAYHLKGGNFATVGDTAERKGGIVLTEAGATNFGKRSAQQEFISAWENVLIKGETDDRVIKNPQGIIKVA